MLLFQSSPNLSAGCSHSMVAGICTGSFNPHPAERLGVSAEGVVTIGDLVTVSILTQPLRLGEDRQISRLVVVSILTQPIGWMQHICYHLIYHIGFNPHLTSWLGAVRLLEPLWRFRSCFNPHQPLGWLGPGPVSILTQPIGSVQHSCRC